MALSKIAQAALAAAEAKAAAAAAAKSVQAVRVPLADADFRRQQASERRSEYYAESPTRYNY